MKISPSKIESLKENEIFVFGSNKEGMHMGGAAKIAHEKFGAIMGQGHGMQGRSYAINTMSGIEIIKQEVEKFIIYASQFVDTTVKFLVTEIGCGIAGHTVEEIAPLFKECPENIILPARFIFFNQQMKNKEIKYYTPEAKEFNHGFEYEIFEDFDHYPEKSWHKFVYGDAGTGYEDMAYPFGSNSMEGIRVKFLDKEDIESLEWETTVISDDSGFWKIKNYTINYNTDNKKAFITENIDGENFVLFKGKLKNKSELKNQMERCGIV